VTSRTLAGILVGALVAVPAGAADEAKTYPPISLDAAVKIAISRNPDVLRAKATVKAQEGAYKAARGTFDPVFNFNPSLKYQKSTLSGSLFQHELDRRTQLQDASVAFGEVRDEYATAIAKQIAGLPPCPGGFTQLTINQSISGNANPNSPFGTVLCVPLVTDTTTPQDPQSLTGLVNSVLLPPTAGAGTNSDFLTQLAPILNLNVQQLSEDLQQTGIEILQQGYKFSIEGNEIAALDFNRLGGTPNLMTVKTAAIEFDIEKTFRFGSTLEFQATFQGQEQGYIGKVLDPVFGGIEVPNLFTSNLTLTLTQPLGQGRGTTATDAAEKAAQANADAARNQYQHQLSRSTLDTVNAYLNVAAAEDNIDLLQLSVDGNKRILDAMQQLMKAGEKSRSEVDRIAARLADVQGSLDDARVSLLQAQGSLALATGLRPEEVRVGPLASERLASTAGDVDFGALARNAAANRRDLRAAEFQRNSAQYLEDAAASNMKHRFDLFLTGGFGNAYYSPFFRVLKDEFINTPTEPKESPVDYFDPKGIFRAWQQRWEPEVAVKLKFSVPFRNRTSRGKLMQAQATRHEADIQYGSLARIVSENVTSQTLAVQRARAELDRTTESVKQHEITWKATQQLLSAGDISVIDSIVTEQDLTSARLNLVQARLTYAQALAQLRFESGTLVRLGDREAEGVNLEGLVEGRSGL
jgi:outer membrane protein TolC